MVKVALYCLIGLFFVACGQKEKETILDMKDISPQAEGDYTQNKKDTIKTVDYGFNTKIADEIGVQVMEMDLLEESMFPDRFEPTAVKKLMLQLKEDQILYCQWTYKDSIKTMNAFYNWIDCFGEKCKSIKFGQSVNFQKDNFILFVNDTSLTYISSQIKLKSEDWLRYFELKNELVDWRILIHQGTRAKANWFKVVEGKKEALDPIVKKV